MLAKLCSTFHGKVVSTSKTRMLVREGGRLQLRDIHTHEILYRWEEHIGDAVILADNRIVSFCRDTQKLRTWDAGCMLCELQLQDVDALVCNVVGDRIATFHSTCVVSIWDSTTMQKQRDIVMDTICGFFGFMGRYLLFGTNQGPLVDGFTVINVDTGEVERRLMGCHTRIYTLRCIDSRHVVMSDDQGQVAMWDIHTGNLLDFRRSVPVMAANANNGLTAFGYNNNIINVLGKMVMKTDSMPLDIRILPNRLVVVFAEKMCIWDTWNAAETVFAIAVVLRDWDFAIARQLFALLTP